MWDDLKGRFMEHIDEVNDHLKASGLPSLGEAPSSTALSNGANGTNGTNRVNGGH